MKKFGKEKTFETPTSKPVEEEVVSEVESVKETTTSEEVAPQEEIKPIKSKVPDVKYRDVVYLGIADTCERVGVVTGNTYTFHKNGYGMPEATQVDERDYPGFIAEKGKGCARRDPSILFMSKFEWDLEIEQARIANAG